MPPIDLDNNATTGVADEVIAAMTPYYDNLYGNAHDDPWPEYGGGQELGLRSTMRAMNLPLRVAMVAVRFSLSRYRTTV